MSGATNKLTLGLIASEQLRASTFRIYSEALLPLTASESFPPYLATSFPLFVPHCSVFSSRDVVVSSLSFSV